MNKTTSVIFNIICEQLGKTSDEQKTQFYNDIIISIFCVFNISPLANNPPPIPYIDINILKMLFYNTDFTNNKPNNIYYDEFINEARNIYDMITVTFADKLQILQNIKIINANIKEVNGVKPSILDVFKTNVIQYMIEIKGDVNKRISFVNQTNFKLLVEEFIDMINKSNAASAVGTLEYLDQLSKFNTTKNICLKNNILKSETINTYENRNNMVELYNESKPQVITESSDDDIYKEDVITEEELKILNNFNDETVVEPNTETTVNETSIETSNETSIETSNETSNEINNEEKSAAEKEAATTESKRKGGWKSTKKTRSKNTNITFKNR
jgi:hypothetical protein